MNRSIFVAGYPQRAHTQHMRVLLTFWYFENSKSAQTCSVLFEWLVKYWLVQTKATLYQEYCLLLKHHCLTFLLKISIHHESSNRFNLDQKASILWFLVELENWKKTCISSQYMFSFPASVLNNLGTIWCCFVQLKNNLPQVKDSYLK